MSIYQQQYMFIPYGLYMSIVLYFVKMILIFHKTCILL